MINSHMRKEHTETYALDSAGIYSDCWVTTVAERFGSKSRSKNTYLDDNSKPIKSPAELRVQLGGLTSSLQRHLVDAYGLKLDDLQVLDTIYLIQMDEKSFISNISDAQQQILDRIQLKLEVP